MINSFKLPVSPVPGPCKGCQDRKSGCHSMCPAYKAYRAKCDEVCAERLHDCEMVAYIGDVIDRFPGKRNI